MSDPKPAKLPPLPLILTANDLMEGHVVYWDGQGWTARSDDARVAMTREAAEELQALLPATEAAVAEPYLVTVRLDEHGLPHPAHYREGIRISGPTFDLEAAA